MIDLSVIVLSYNTKDLTVLCLESIITTYIKELKDDKIEIIVADNSSTDNTKDAIEKYVKANKNIIFLPNKENFGFSKGNNLGAQKAKGKYIVFLNSDTLIKEKGLIDAITVFEKDSSVAVVGCSLKNSDESTQYSAGKFLTLFNLFLYLLGGEKIGLLKSSPNKIAQVDWVNGACMIVRSDIFKKLGGFDEKIFMYTEDMEFCYRVKKAGYTTLFYPFFTLLHVGQGSSNREFAIINIYKGLLYFYSKHRSVFEYTLAKMMLYIKAYLSIMIGISTNNRSLVQTYKRAIAYL